jgi:hypothetical protein
MIGNDAEWVGSFYPNGPGAYGTGPHTDFGSAIATAVFAGQSAYRVQTRKTGWLQPLPAG